MSEFKIPPVSTLIGSTLPNFVHILSKNKVSPRYYINIFITLLIIIIAMVFAPKAHFRRLQVRCDARIFECPEIDR